MTGVLREAARWLLVAAVWLTSLGLYQDLTARLAPLVRSCDPGPQPRRLVEIQPGKCSPDNMGGHNLDPMTPVTPTVYLVTPTYARMTQKADLIRMMYTLAGVACLHWVVVEDADSTSSLVARILSRSGLPFTHLATPSIKNETTINKSGVLQRNLGLAWIRGHTAAGQEGAVYFADDDNTYDRQLFDLIRKTQKVSVWPVALAGWCSYESIHVREGKVRGFHVCFAPERHFAVDMAGFAVSLPLLHRRPHAAFSYSALVGQLESHFISSLGITLEDLEPVANNFTEVLVWHTKTLPPSRGLNPPYRAPLLEI